MQQPQISTRALHTILDIELGITGIDYLQELVSRTAKTLDVTYALIGRPDPEKENHILTDTVWCGDKFCNNISYNLDGTPCQRAYNGKRIEMHSCDVASKFPLDTLLQDMGVTSYAGAPIFAPDHTLLGLFIVLDQKPFTEPEFIENIMDHLSIRIGAELDRWQLENRLQKEVQEKTHALEEKIEELEKAREQLIQSEKMASLGRMVAGFAHEINTPIGIAVGGASQIDESVRKIVNLVKKEEIPEDEFLDHMDVILQSSELTLTYLRKSAQLIGSFKRTAVDQSNHTYHHFNLCSGLQDIVSSLQNQFKKTQIEIDITCSDDLSSIYSLPGSIDQVMTNLLQNSYLHAFNNGQLAGKISIIAQQISDNIEIIYRDNGQGMQEEVTQHIFEPFFTTARGKGGSGLGLFICYNIVTSELCGTILCQSDQEKGTEFRISIPYSHKDEE